MRNLFWFLLGAGLGAGFTYYLACQRREDWRSRTSHQLTHAGDRVRDHAEMASHEVRAHLNQLGAIKDELVSDASAHGRGAAQAAARQVGR